MIGGTEQLQGVRGDVCATVFSPTTHRHLLPGKEERRRIRLHAILPSLLYSSNKHIVSFCVCLNVKIKKKKVSKMVTFHLNFKRMSSRSCGSPLSFFYARFYFFFVGFQS
jgi:hypothetical protein